MCLKSVRWPFKCITIIAGLFKYFYLPHQLYSYERKDCLESAETSLLGTFACICMCVFPFVIVIAQIAVMMCSINHIFLGMTAVLLFFIKFAIPYTIGKDIPFIFFVEQYSDRVLVYKNTA